MKKMKKGFTIVELVIVIAVIAILAGVLIPTFASVSQKAKESAALQEANHALTAVLVEEKGSLDATMDYYFVVDGYTFKFDGSVVVKVDALAEGAQVKYNNADEDETNNLVDLAKKVVIYTVAKA